MLAPFNYSNWVPLINCPNRDSPKDQNCATIRIIIEGQIRVILYTTKAIKKGEELLYDYNGLMN
jgi:SET domain-containing protein